MEILINDTYGGFRLSAKVLVKLLEINSDILIQNTLNEYGYEDMSEFIKNDIKLREYNMSLLFGEEITLEGIHDTCIYKKGFIYTIDNESKKVRTNKYLINIVRELGEDANSFYSSLKIINIPDNTNFLIKVNDGYESIEILK